jgi:hypothetical protein
VKATKATMMLAAAGLAISPVAANAAASSLSIARAAPQLTAPSYLQDDEHHGNRTAMVALGGILLVLIIVVAIAGDSSNPVSP